MAGRKSKLLPAKITIVSQSDLTAAATEGDYLPIFMDRHDLRGAKPEDSPRRTAGTSTFRIDTA